MAMASAKTWSLCRWQWSELRFGLGAEEENMYLVRPELEGD